MQADDASKKAKKELEVKVEEVKKMEE